MFTSISNQRGLLTTTSAFKNVTTPSRGNILISYSNFIKFMPHMRGEWKITVGTSNVEGFVGDEVVGQYGFTWNNVVSGVYQNLDFCYLYAENKRGDKILCQIFG
jgi:hypothetical protein